MKCPVSGRQEVSSYFTGQVTHHAIYHFQDHLSVRGGEGVGKVGIWKGRAEVGVRGWGGWGKARQEGEGKGAGQGKGRYRQVGRAGR